MRFETQSQYNLVKMKSRTPQCHITSGDICRCLCIAFPLPQSQEAALEIESVTVVFRACFVICIKEVSTFFRVIACMS